MNWDNSVLRARMEKTTKWITKVLFGKTKFINRSDTCFSMKFKSAEMGIQYCTPKLKGKWSFKRLSGKYSWSFEAVKAKFTSQASQNDATASVVIRVDIENVAASKIQAVFRSFLARKALHALRGLVKLQALVRGCIVRRQTEAALTQMHALMSIQIQARIQRIKKNEGSMNNCPARYNRRSPTNTFSKSSVNLSVLERFEFKDYSTKIEISPQVEHKPNPSKSPLVHREPYSPNPWSNGRPLLPNYMTNTVSSRAKSRSHSDPIHG